MSIDVLLGLAGDIASDCGGKAYAECPERAGERAGGRGEADIDIAGCCCEGQWRQTPVFLFALVRAHAHSIVLLSLSSMHFVNVSGLFSLSPPLYLLQREYIRVTAGICYFQVCSYARVWFMNSALRSAWLPAGRERLGAGVGSALHGKRTLEGH